jgi:hypothetical protein
MIKALRILPPLAFARFGSASEPQDNYDLEADENDPLGFRRIIPADTLIVGKNGTIKIRRAVDPSQLKPADLNNMFRDGTRIRPVAPFFELFAVTEKDELVPLTLDLHKKYQLGPIEWQVRVENRKVFRRTGDENDRVVADTKIFSDHARKQLLGKCPHFIPGAAIDFGSVQFIKPNRRNLVCSQFRLRFTPGAGRIYGPVGDPRSPGDSPDAVTPIYNEGNWTQFDGEKAGKKKRNNSVETWPRQTLPSSLFANKDGLPPWLNYNNALSRGYLDDACDGFIYVTMKGPNNKTFDAMARICSGPPDFVLDSRFVRTLADDFDQIVNGPGASDLDVAEARTRALDIVRRAYETVRLMNVAVMNGNDVNGRSAEAFDTMPAEVAFTTERPVQPVVPSASVDTAHIMALHQQVFAALSAGAAPWFSRLLRQPEEIGDLTDRGRRKMPALMSGADSFYLALTRRQIATVEMAAGTGALVPRNLTAQQKLLTDHIQHKAAGNPVNSRPEMAVANCCPGLEVDFRAIWRRLFKGIELSEHENYVVAGSAVDDKGNTVDLKGYRLLRVDGNEVTVDLKGSSPSVPGGNVTVRFGDNPNGVWTMEWSNCLAHVLALRRSGKQKVKCEFTARAAEKPVREEKKPRIFTLKIMDFFEPDTAVISKKLAKPGELTQGLCSPWQNDLRECSCYYWASSRPDFVNRTLEDDGLSHGDNWLAKIRTGEYIPDDYVDSRLIGYEDLFKDWEQLQFQIGGKDSAPNLPGYRTAKRPRKS